MSGPYVGFNEAPNLLNTETRDGYSDIHTRIRWDEAVETIGLSQEWGASFLHFDDVQQISKMITSSSVLLELQWYGAQESYFEYSLNGSSEAIAEMRRQCNEY